MLESSGGTWCEPVRSFDDRQQSFRQFALRDVFIHEPRDSLLAPGNRLRAYPAGGEHNSEFISPPSHYRFEKLATPHSRQRRFSRDVISPQFGHILCPDPVPSGFLSRIQRSSRIVNSRPRERPAMLIKKDLPWRVPRLPRSNVPMSDCRALGYCLLYSNRLRTFSRNQHCQYGRSIANTSRNRHESFRHGRMPFRQSLKARADTAEFIDFA